MWLLNRLLRLLRLRRLVKPIQIEPAESVVNLHEINRIRHRAGKPGLTIHKCLQKEAQGQADFLHQRRRMWKAIGNPHAGMEERLARCGFRSGAENFGSGFESSTVASRAWLKSKPHRENILGDYEYAGIARAGTDWIVLFAK